MSTLAVLECAVVAAIQASFFAGIGLVFGMPWHLAVLMVATTAALRVVMGIGEAFVSRPLPASLSITLPASSASTE